MKNWCWLLLIGLLLVTTGCTQRAESGDTVVYTISTLVAVGVTIGCIVATVLGFFLKRFSSYAWAALVLGPIGLLVICPGLFMDRFEISDKHLKLRTGIWSMTATCDIDLNVVKDVSFEKEITKGRRGRKITKYKLFFRMKGSGERIELSVGTLVDAAADDLIERLQKNNIPIHNMVGPNG